MPCFWKQGEGQSLPLSIGSRCWRKVSHGFPKAGVPMDNSIWQDSDYQPWECDRSNKGIFFFIFIVIQLHLYAFSPHPSTPPQPNPPPSPASTLPLDFVHVSLIVVSVIPSPHCPLPTPTWLFLDCS